MAHTYAAKPSDFTVGQRVSLHPATDWWMRGARYGTVVAIGIAGVSVELDSNIIRFFRAADLRAL